MLSSLSLGFAPVLPLWLLATIGTAALLAILPMLLARARGGWLRLAFAAALLAVLANPLLLRKQSESLDDVVIAMVDRSASNRLGEREAQTDAAVAALERALAAGGAELRIVESPRGADRSELIGPLLQAVGEVAPDRLSGLVIISDGRIDDTARAAPLRALGKPVHTLLTGVPDMPDRRIEILRAPEYALVDRPATIRVQVSDENMTGDGPARLTVRRADGRVEQRLATPGRPLDIDILPERRGEILLDIAVEAAPGEEILVNNRALFSINAVRDRLRVLLVSGEPHPGERVWRDTLKSDPAVDLIHFTILRLPSSQDPTPVGQLSLIPFPTERLFAEQLDDFDLVIFDRYSLRGVLEMRYFDNLLAYVRDGGALFVANGPEFAGEFSLARTPLAEVLPAAPTGGVREGGFRPGLTAIGRRHPVTSVLASGAGEENWGRWFRMVESDVRGGEVLLTADGAPLLILDRAGEGRVAQMMSDQVWLWARGIEGGGPWQELLRRSVHWLMQEPDLEEEALIARGEGNAILVERRSLDRRPADVTVTGPDGTVRTLRLEPDPDGVARGRIEAPDFGLYRLGDGVRETVAGIGPAGSHELSHVIPSDDFLAPLAAATGGGAFRLLDGMPEIRRTGPRAATAGRDWIGLPRREAARTLSVAQSPLLPPWAGLALLAGLLAAAWWRESGGR